VINPDAIRVEDGYSVQCAHCRKIFESARASAEFCGSACRGANHRAKKRRERAINAAIESVRLVINNMPWVGQSDEYLALQKLETIIKRGLSNVEER